LQAADCELQIEKKIPSADRSGDRQSASIPRSVVNSFQVGIPRLRWPILRTLLHKEVLRHLANRGGLALALLLVVAALLLSLFRNGDKPSDGLSAAVHHCFIDFWEDSPWLQHMRQHVPPDLRSQVQFRHASRAPTQGGNLVYPSGAGAIQIRPSGESVGGPRYTVWIWQPADASGMAPFKEWFWKESQHYAQQRAATLLQPQDRAAFAVPELEEQESVLEGGLDSRSSIATALVLFGLFFVCVYLLPSLTCEERERGVLLAQALSPATPFEILVAKLLFYPILGIVLAAVIGGITNPAILTRPFFWLGLLAAAIGSLGIGLTIASLARTQRAASMGALCYMMAVALLLYICQQNSIPVLPYVALEYHCPRVLHAALSNAVYSYHWGNLAGAYILAFVWVVIATALFRRWGWQ
jgi:ABC-type multidrug transport system permease subunit